MGSNFTAGLKKASDVLRHPFTILVIGSVLSSILLPSILAEAAKNESTRKEKLELAYNFLNRNSEINQNFNSLLVSLELFHKYSSPKYLHEEQKDLRKTTKDLYQKFNIDVWSWHWDLYEKAKIWKLLPQTDDPLVNGALLQYSESWKKVMERLPSFWAACLDANYRVHDSKVTKLMEETRQEFNNSIAVRDSAIRYVVSKFEIEQFTNLKQR